MSFRSTALDGYNCNEYERANDTLGGARMSAETLPPLTFSEAQMRTIMREVGDLIVDHFVNLKDQPVTMPSTLESLQGGLSELPPHHPLPVSELLQQVKTFVFAEMTHQDHPRNFAFVPGPSNFMGAMADALSSALNVFCGAFIGPSGTAQIEIITIEWLRQLFNFPADAGGLFVSGGSMANLTCLAVARHQLPLQLRPKAIFYFSDQTHSSVAKGMRTLGFQPDQLRKIKSNDGYTLPMDALYETIAIDRARGMLPFCVIANAGTTNTGAIDPLNAIADLCEQDGLWMHIDGAYGGSAALTDEGSVLLSGLNRANSLTIDPHKWMFQPYEIGCALIRDKTLLNDTFKVSAEYLKIVEQKSEQPNFSDYGVQLTRGFRALKLWMSIKAFGIDAFKTAINIGMDRARQTEARLRVNPNWDIVTPAQLGIVTFRYLANSFDEATLDLLNMRIADDMINSGFALLSPTILSGKTVLRMCTINPRTTNDDILQTIDRLEAFAEKNLAAM
jgi:aromatic-L-amino-acid/L-tryptophan decarboxylase